MKNNRKSTREHWFMTTATCDPWDGWPLGRKSWPKETTTQRNKKKNEKVRSLDNNFCVTNKKLSAKLPTTVSLVVCTAFTNRTFKTQEIWGFTFHLAINWPFQKLFKNKFLYFFIITNTQPLTRRFLNVLYCKCLVKTNQL